MSDNFSVQSIYGEYQVTFGSYLDQLPAIIEDGDIVIIDENILTFHPEISPIFSDQHVLKVKANEDAKTYQSIGILLGKIIESGFTKANKIIAIGGGVTQDITAFSSSILFRGVDWVFFPTNLLTQCDSCIGSKTSVNFDKYKNQLGGFYPPRKIIIDSKFLDTISPLEVASGLGEMMHYFLVDGVSSLDELNQEIVQAKTDRATLNRLIHRSLTIKRKMIEIDEFDKGPRNVFNYGHTFGHAIETTSGYSVPHGVAVAYGIDLANLISERMGLIDMSLRNEIRPILENIWQEKALPDINITQYMNALSKDKKNTGKDINAILTKGLGNMFKSPIPRTEDVKELINNFFQQQLYSQIL